MPKMDKGRILIKRLIKQKKKINIEKSQYKKYIKTH